MARAEKTSPAQPLHGVSKFWQLLPTLIFTSTAVFVFSSVLHSVYQRYGINIFLPDSIRTLSISIEEWRSILPSKTIVLIGGPHRGGTTVLWDELRRHPDVGDFGTQFESGSDFSEGIFLQNVYPRFGVGNEFRSLPPAFGGSTQEANRRSTGLGKYALDPSVHLIETHPSISADSQASVLNSWGYHWGKEGLEKPVLLEKSPPNLHLGRYLQGLLNLGLSTPVVRFIFISRHPLGNALAHRALPECSTMSVESLVTYPSCPSGSDSPIEGLEHHSLLLLP